MDDDAPKAAPKAGRRAGRQVNNWGDDSAAPPEPQKGGFGLDSAFGLGAPSSPPQPPMPGFGEDSSPARGAGGSSGGGALPSMGGGDEERTTPASRRRTRDMPDRAESGAQAASKALNLDLLSGDDSKKFIGVSRRKQEQLARGDEESSKKQIKYESMTTGADGIMDIPELEEEGREDLSNVVAEAPKVRTNKVQGMEELEEEAHYKLPAMDDRDIDLSLLTAVLCSSEQVQEADEPWDPDIVLTEVASAIYTEREKAEGGDAPTEPDEPLNEMK